MKFFSYDPDNGFELHNTEAEAKASAEAAIQMYRDDADPEWPGEVDGVCWGEVRQHVKEVGAAVTDCGRETCDYQLAGA